MSTVLCVDDHPQGLAIRKFMRETKGYTALTATDGPSGIALLREQTVDVVVLDYKMPGMDGAEVAELMRGAHP